MSGKIRFLHPRFSISRQWPSFPRDSLKHSAASTTARSQRAVWPCAGVYWARSHPERSTGQHVVTQIRFRCRWGRDEGFQVKCDPYSDSEYPSATKCKWPRGPLLSAPALARQLVELGELGELQARETTRKLPGVQVRFPWQPSIYLI